MIPKRPTRLSGKGGEHPYRVRLPRFLIFRWVARAAAVTALAAPLALSAVLRVDSRVSPEVISDGLTWATAFPRLEQALALAGAGDEIWVATGTYGPAAELGFVLPSGVQLYGGFAGRETERDQRRPLENVTILQGDGLRSRVVTIAPEAAADTRLDGFQLSNGRARQGGGVYCQGGAAVIANNVITANQAIEAGGGIYCENASARIEGNAIYGNQPRTLDNTAGGGIYIRGVPPRS